MKQERSLKKIFGLIRLARPADWIKNLFVVPALLAAGKAGDMESVLLTVIAFASFSCVASGVYGINDALDWREDRKHPVKRRRPIPSGQVTPETAFFAGVIWIVVGFLIARVLVGPALVSVLAMYLALQIAYNAMLKRIATVDVIALSIGFVLRAVAGAVAINVLPSIWLLASVFFLCLYLAQIKRLCDLSSIHSDRKRNDGEEIEWQAPAGYQSADELHWMLSISASLAMVTFLMYAMADDGRAAEGLPGVRGFVLLTPFVVASMFRLYRSASRGGYDNPLTIVATDLVMAASNLCFVVGAVWFLYVPWGEQFIERLLNP